MVTRMGVENNKKLRGLNMAVIGFLFIIVGFLIGMFSDKESIAITIIIIISVLWAFGFGPWAVATFIELSIGYYIFKLITMLNTVNVLAEMPATKTKIGAELQDSISKNGVVAGGVTTGKDLSYKMINSLSEALAAGKEKRVPSLDEL